MTIHGIRQKGFGGGLGWEVRESLASRRLEMKKPVLSRSGKRALQAEEQARAKSLR